MKKEKKVSVLYVHANNTDIGGADYCLFKLASELDKNQFRPVVCLSKKTEILELYNREGIKTYIIDMERIKKSKNSLYLFKLLIKFLPTIQHIRRIIKNEQIDLVHGNDLLDIYGPIAGRFAQIPAVQHCRMILPGQSIVKWLLTHIAYHINHTIVAISKGVENDMFSFAEKKIFCKIIVCHDWFDFDSIGHGASFSDIRKEFTIADNAPIVGVVGRLEPWKGQHVFLKAAAIVSKMFPRSVFFIVGGSVKGRGREKYSDELKKLAFDLGIKDEVIFLGHRNDICDIMSSLDIFVLSSVTPEPLGQVVMEASACGKPVIASDTGGPPEIITHGETGLLYPMGDHEKMAEAIIYLLTNPNVAFEMGIASKKRVEDVFNKKTLCTRIENVYRDMALGLRGGESIDCK